MIKIINKYPHIKFIAHRGLPSVTLENTNEGFLEAAKHPFFGIETDVHLTRDLIPILHHDDNLITFTLKNIQIKDSDYLQIKNLMLNSHFKIPLLVDYLNICRTHHKHAFIELKSLFTSDEVNHILDIIKAYDYLSNTTIISFHLSNLKIAHKRYPNVPIQYLTDKFDQTILENIHQYRFDISLHHSVITKQIVEEVHKINLKVGAWTINDLNTIDKLARFGVDYITTDGI